VHAECDMSAPATQPGLEWRGRAKRAARLRPPCSTANCKLSPAPEAGPVSGSNGLEIQKIVWRCQVAYRLVVGGCLVVCALVLTAMLVGWLR
jgi:hypothetical protein